MPKMSMQEDGMMPVGRLRGELNYIKAVEIACLSIIAIGNRQGRENAAKGGKKNEIRMRNRKD